MGDRLRKQGRRLLAAAYDAALPALLMYLTMLLSLIARGTSFAEGVPLRFFAASLVVCYLTAYPITLVTHNRHYADPARVDEALIGNAFGGFSKRDRLFCRGLEAYSKAKARLALEIFQTVYREFTLDRTEQGVCEFYIGRCYQLLRCPSNAVGYYKDALEHGFSEAEAMIFLARSYCDNGDFDESYAVYQTLLEKELPQTMQFVCTDMGFLYLKQYQPETAVKWFQDAMKRSESYPFALGGMAIALLQLGKFRKARTMATLAVTNRMPDAAYFRQYFSEVEQTVLHEHPEWDSVEGGEKTAQPESQVQQGGAPDGSL